MELILGSESALVVRVDGGYWHYDVAPVSGKRRAESMVHVLSAQAQEKPAQKGTSFTLYVALQDFNATNGGTHFVPWAEDGRSGDAIISPDLPAGSVIMYDSVGLLHRAADHVPPPGSRDVARWVTWTTMVSASHPDHLYPFQNGEYSLFDVLGKDEAEYRGRYLS